MVGGGEDDADSEEAYYHVVRSGGAVHEGALPGADEFGWEE